MKIKRYVAKDMRTALAQIKEELGADAVIMSNKKVPEGVELMAAVDSLEQVPAKQPMPTEATETINNRPFKEDQVSLSSQPVATAVHNKQTANQEETTSADSLSALLNRNIQQSNSTNAMNHSAQPEQTMSTNASVSNMPNMPLDAEQESIKEQFKSFTDRLQQSAMVSHEQAHFNKSMNNAQQAQGINDASTDNHYVQQQDFDAIKNEMASIRQLLEHQVSGLMWQDLAQRDPAKAMLVDKLTSLGISDSLAEQVAGFVPKHESEAQAWKSALHLLVQQISTTNNEIIKQGGIVALVGPTGVGKTTTIAKLAARFAQIHGSDSVALISTDTFRIAGFEQLQTYARIIGCQAKLAKDNFALDGLLQEFANKKLILIDTAGMGQRDLRLVEHLTTLISNTRVRIKNYLVLAANTQQRVMQENVERFKKIPLVGCIYTKLDESLSFGEIISTAIQHSLPIGYLTDGQRVPEDIKVANAEKLVMLASKMINESVYSNPQRFQSQVNMPTATV